MKLSVTLALIVTTRSPRMGGGSTSRSAGSPGSRTSPINGGKMGRMILRLRAG